MHKLWYKYNKFTDYWYVNWYLGGGIYNRIILYSNDTDDRYAV